MNNMIDHTLLLSTATTSDIETLCKEAVESHFFSVCVNPCHVKAAYQALENTSVKVCTVIGFPLGANTTNTKELETKDAIANGASEIDMVVNIGHVLEHSYTKVEEEITAIKEACTPYLLKVIFETCLLTDEEIETLCRICKKIGVDFVKTSTGFSNGGATVKAVSLMRKTVGKEIGVKASGGVRTKELADAMIEAGANRIGTSAGVAIVNGTELTGKEY
ncbi:deoxyribose-phosphate aldolase [Photobacterium sagamiensis]|uniref:deoxyribose-phosphate aldolase n=1 Tax=Photobacterium sagamiensis TaxID=2910241 RepID=UPI003D11B6D5